MASLPPQRPTSQRRASPPAESTSAQQDQAPRKSSFSTQSVDSQTLLLNSSPSQSAKPAPQEQQAPPRSQTPEEDDEPRRCWICFNDETEDDENTSEWRSPCNCSLVAHEKCLLDWIADMEAPDSRRRAGTRANKVQCPQCKAEIKIQRPRSVIVDAVRLAERLTGTLLLPGFGLALATSSYATLSLAGSHTIFQIFGTEDALRILAPLYKAPDMTISSPVLRMLTHLQHHWRLDLGLPLIPTVLVASRTTFADSFLPFLPLIFFVSSGQPGDEMLQLQWPPSAAFSFAALPYIRGFYNAFYERVLLPREQQWLKEIQPRAGTDDNAAAELEIDEEELEHIHHEHDHDHHHHHHHHDEVIEEVEIEVDFDIFEGWNNGAQANNDAANDDPPVEAPAQPIDAPPMDDETDSDDDMPGLIELDAQEAAPAPNIPAQPAQPRPRRVRRERNLISTTSLADTILGALIFPSIAAAMGELLRHTLPKSWVTPPKGTPATSWLGGWISIGGKSGSSDKPTGFLQTRWGRSLVGGCMFVGLKDMILLYVRWKMAQNHRRRKILDRDPKEKKAGRT